MQLNDLLQKLNGVKGCGNKYSALCPSQNLSIKRSNLSTLSSPSTQCAVYVGSADVDSSVDENIGASSTPPSTLQKAHVSGVCVDDVVSVDKNPSLEEWGIIDESIKDEDMPEGFL